MKDNVYELRAARVQVQKRNWIVMCLSFVSELCVIVTLLHDITRAQVTIWPGYTESEFRLCRELTLRSPVTDKLPRAPFNVYPLTAILCMLEPYDIAAK